MPDNLLQIRIATQGDLEAIMAIERMPGYEWLVGRSSTAFHEKAMADPDYVYLVGCTADDAVAAIAILRDLSNPMGNTCLKRFAVVSPGQGLGKSMLAGVINWVFEHTQTHRFWLDHIITNHRARAVYEANGFVREGIMRQAYQTPDGERVDLAMMSLIRPHWSMRKV